MEPLYSRRVSSLQAHPQALVGHPHSSEGIHSQERGGLGNGHTVLWTPPAHVFLHVWQDKRSLAALRSWLLRAFGHGHHELVSPYGRGPHGRRERGS